MKKWLLAAVVVVGLALVVSAIMIQSNTHRGNNLSQGGYSEIAEPVQVVESGRTEVLEYFWFGCPHCYEFEPHINGWAASKPDHVNFIREAPPLNPGWISHSRAYYAARTLGVLEQFFEPMFHAIHRDKRALNRAVDIADFAAEQGIDREKFIKAMQSDEVSVLIDQALKKASASGIRGVPSVVIDGKYLTGASEAGSFPAVIEVINRLTETPP